MLRFGCNLKTLDAEIQFIGAAYGDSTETIELIKHKIESKKRVEE